MGIGLFGFVVSAETSTDDGRLATRRIERWHIDEVRDLGSEVDAVNEDIALNDL